MCFITVDRSGFPLIRVDRLGLDVHLFPVLKVQFEAFLADQNEFDDSWYAEVLARNPRCSWRHLRNDIFEQQFLTAILPEEVLAFADWLGAKFRLLSVDEWQRIYRLWANTPAPSVIDIALDSAGGSVKIYLERLLHNRPNSTLAELSRMTGGVMEWTRDTRGYKLLGEPRESFSHQLFDWRTPVRPTAQCSRNRLFGFRLASQINGPL